MGGVLWTERIRMAPMCPEDGHARHAGGRKGARNGRFECSSAGLGSHSNSFLGDHQTCSQKCEYRSDIEKMCGWRTGLINPSIRSRSRTNPPLPPTIEESHHKARHGRRRPASRIDILLLLRSREGDDEHWELLRLSHYHRCHNESRLVVLHACLRRPSIRA